MDLCEVFDQIQCKHCKACFEGRFLHSDVAGKSSIPSVPICGSVRPTPTKSQYFLGKQISSLVAYKNHIAQDMENYSPRAKSSVLPVFATVKFYGNTATPSYSHVVCGYFQATMAGVSRCNKCCITHKAEHIYSVALYKKMFDDP